MGERTSELLPKRASAFLYSCTNDKRCAISFALENHAKTALFLDADTRIHRALPTEVEVKAPLMTVYFEVIGRASDELLMERRC
jgi:hypothetical protein